MSWFAPARGSLVLLLLAGGPACRGLVVAPSTCPDAGCEVADGGSPPDAGAVFDAGASATTVVLHPAPAGYPAHPGLEVRVNGQPVHVYSALVSTEDRYIPRPHSNQTRTVGFVSFDHDGPVAISVTATDRPFATAAVKPAKRAIAVSVTGETASFVLDQPGNVALELDGDIFRHLYFFTNTPETNPPLASSPDVVFLGPGVHEQTVNLTSGQTLYLAGGAILEGKIAVRNAKRVVLRGRGIVSAAGLDAGNVLLIRDAEDIQLEDLVFLDSPSWSLRLEDVKQARLSAVRVLGHRQNSDGIDLMNASDVEVERCFVRTFDDAVVVKVMDDDLRDGGVLNSGVSTRIRVANCLLIQDHGGGPLKIGANEMLGLSVSEVSFTNSDLIGARGDGLLLIKNQGTATVSRVLFEDIRAEGARISYTGVNSGARTAEVQLLGVIVRAENSYLDVFSPGRVEDVTFRRVALTGVVEGPLPPTCVLSGLDADHQVTGVRLEGVFVDGHLVDGPTSTACRVQQNAFVSDVSFSGP